MDRHIFNESEMALLYECTGRYAQKGLDTADIVREAIFRQPSHTASVQRKMAAMYMQDKYHNARGVIYTIGLAVLAVLLVWKFVVR